MEIAAIALVVLVLVVFFVLKKKKSTGLETSEPAIEPPIEAPLRGAPAQTEHKAVPGTSHSVEVPTTPSAVGEEPTIDPADESVSSESNASSEEDATNKPGSVEGDQQEAPPSDPVDASPPPPPSREHAIQTPEPGKRKVELQSLRKGLAKSRSDDGFFGRLKGLFSSEKVIDPNLAAEIEEILLTSDVGVKTTESILERIKDSLDKGELKNEEQVWETLRDEARRTLSVDGRAGAITLSAPLTVVLLVGVNGAGKTTTIGKLAQQFIGSGKKVMLAAGDTFRAAAVDQLRAWGTRVGCAVVSGKDGADPSSVLFDAIQSAQESGVDVLLADTAGRLHTKTNLMLEMSKISKTLEKALPGAPHEVLLVIDSTNGQNAMAQAKEFKEAVNITGLVLTKLDGTARGGAALGICGGLQIPIRYIGVGEKTEDLLEFDTNAFVEALLGSEKTSIAA